MIAVVVVRDGTLPLGAEEAVDEAGGRVLLVGTGTGAAGDDLQGATTEVTCWEAGPYQPGTWAGALGPELRHEDVVLLPASADGRDLAPRLAQVMGRPLHAGAIEVTATGATLIRGGGQSLLEVDFDGPVVATLQPGSRGTDRRGAPAVAARTISPAVTPRPDAAYRGLSPADPATMELREATRIVAGGAGLGSAEHMALLGRVAAALGCATGATRVVTDAGWAPFDRQIGTTGQVVDPDLYIAVGISGAVQHVSGIGQPKDVVSINLDPSAPMMALADLALVTDAVALTEVLAERLGLGPPGGNDG
ncbi:MAG: mycofactocin-associated electron transfer flavoprotein alpha subunit [Acidimicrobiales bacterium]